jgi:hypothetical protein
MTLLERNAVQEPVLRKETVPVASLGGDVVVRGRLLSESLQLSALQSALREPLPGESEDDARARAGSVMVAKTLHLGVVLADGEPMWSEQQWNVFGAANLVEAMTLFSTVQRLSGSDLQAIEKN